MGLHRPWVSPTLDVSEEEGATEFSGRSHSSVGALGVLIGSDCLKSSLPCSACARAAFVFDNELLLTE